MIIVESGGTKSTWVFNSTPNTIQSFETVGLHPQESTLDKEKILQSLVEEHNIQGREIYFYGAGCESVEAKVKITAFLESLGLRVRAVQTDIYAACLAHFGHKKGSVGIIGTGAVAAKFDGEKVVQQTSGLGYLIGDEGSGFDIGKRLLKKYFQNELPLNVKESIENYFNHQSILHRIHEPDGRMHIAGLAKIARKFSKEPPVHSVLISAFTDFCKFALNPLGVSSSVHFIGSVAFYFQAELTEALEKEGYTVGEIKKEAVFEVFNFLSSESPA
ncbi:hypothetical protein [Brumimicrobium oceani]|uniref:ATPase n=1 Tax=Brumimicrobium oceani TaxID=2100725 RepID=A0A2U2XF02_9FLAO|nr:hypothetical protein [Brumimicrobium oceani]PWH86378.1 hypothetical protein DIT68_03815 [Brumimicrobium oceani]